MEKQPRPFVLEYPLPSLCASTKQSASIGGIAGSRGNDQESRDQNISGTSWIWRGEVEDIAAYAFPREIRGSS